ncbi:MAG: hypothetical protein HXX12_05990 [Geothrix sp.]|uniref:hypothetical protein n=1 Tax=Geothrix sp. TaxID=1962974 RepID=UPI0017E057CA|nr:hypothetical protein [Geothrix sp.]NWJ40504.1 hypothetical protein [Geothrix sp.]WIL21491.1 MAG: hypothetical protein QOZ81_000754 [Geothrix sp.]
MPICRHTMHLSAAPAAVHPLLCPVREHDWIEGWRATVLRSASGLAEEGCVFTTPGPDGPDWLWIIAVHQPEHLRFAIHALGSHATLLDLRLGAEGAGTRLDWTYDLVPLTPAGKAFAAGYAARFPVAMALLERRLAHFLATGTMLQTV